MKLTVKHQETYSRGDLLLRSIFGWLYMFLPHMFLLMFVGIWSSILTFISFWSILFTGRYPQSFFEFQVGFQAWQLRLNARSWNLCDGYPSFGIKGTDEYTSFEMPYPESLSRGMALVKFLFGWLYCLAPHIIVLYFRTIASTILSFFAWWAVLFTGKYPASWHKFNVGTLRWGVRIGLYMGYMTDDYPPFSGAEGTPVEQTAPPAAGFAQPA